MHKACPTFNLKGTSTKEKIAIATAPHWSGPYTICPKEPVLIWLDGVWWPATVSSDSRSGDEQWRSLHLRENYSCCRGYHMLVCCQLHPFSSMCGTYGYSYMYCRDELSWTPVAIPVWDYSWETIWHGWMIPSVTLYAIRNSRTFLGPWRLFTSCISWYWLMNYLHGDSCHWGAGHGWTLRDATHWKMNVSIIFEFNRLFSITVICISFLVLYPACFFILS